MSTVTWSVPGVSCEHCRHAIESEVSRVAGVRAVTVDLEAKTVTVAAAIDEAGYDVVR